MRTCCKPEFFKQVEVKADNVHVALYKNITEEMTQHTPHLIEYYQIKHQNHSIFI